MPFTGMNTNTRYVCYIKHKQAAINKWIMKQVRKKILAILKISSQDVYMQQRIFKNSTFLQVLLKDFAETFQNAY